MKLAEPAPAAVVSAVPPSDDDAAPTATDNYGDDKSGTGLDVLTLSGGLSRHWRLPEFVRRLGRLAQDSEQRRQRDAGISGGAVLTGLGGTWEGSLSTFVDVKTGCLLSVGDSPKPFTQEVRM